jgi:hypothetical protein
MFFPQICRSSACLVYDLRKVSEEEVARGEVSPKSTIRQRVAEGKSLRFDHSLGSKVIADAFQQLIARQCRWTNHADTAGTRSYLVRTFVYDARQSTTGGSPDTPCSSDNDTLYSTLALSHCKMLNSTWVPPRGFHADIR